MHTGRYKLSSDATEVYRRALFALHRGAAGRVAFRAGLPGGWGDPMRRLDGTIRQGSGTGEPLATIRVDIPSVTAVVEFPDGATVRFVGEKVDVLDRGKISTTAA